MQNKNNIILSSQDTDNIVLETKDITKVYGKTENRVVAVDSVTISLQAHEVLLIIGPSGSGKTTLLSMMGCILRPSSGDVLINGKAVSGLSERELPFVRRRYIGFVFQSFNLFPSLRAVENIELILRLKQTEKEKVPGEAFKLLDMVGLRKRADNYPEDLSGGEKQRVALARALAGDPQILLADEPTANLDSKTGLEVLRLLRDLAEHSGKAVAVVSHDPKAETLAHRVVTLEDGKVLQ